MKYTVKDFCKKYNNEKDEHMKEKSQFVKKSLKVHTI